MNEIWFYDNIWQRLITALSTYNNAGNILINLSIAIIPSYLLYRLIRLHPMAENLYAGTFPEEVYRFDRHRKSDLLALAAVFAAFALYLFWFCGRDMSFFRDGEDSMFFSAFVTNGDGGIFISCVHARFFILSHVEWVILGSITPNYYLLSLFVFGQLLFICWLMYRFLDFVSVPRRLSIIALFILFPAVFAAFDGHIFCERNMIMLLLLGLLAFKKFSRSNDYLYLWLGVLCFNLMLYFKEVNLLFLGGILLVSFAYNLLRGNITPQNFLHPLQTLRRFPIEVLLFFCALTFLLLLLYHTFGYISNHYTNSLRMQTAIFIRQYILEMLLGGICLLFFIRDIWKRRGIFTFNPLFNEGLLCGSLLVLGFLWGNRYGHDIPALNSPYFAVPAVIGCLLYLARVKISNGYFYMLIAALLALSIAYDARNRQDKSTEELRLTYEEIVRDAEKDKRNPLNLYIDAPKLIYWYSMAWDNVFKGYNPEMEVKIHGYLQRPSEFRPQSGDYYLFWHWGKRQHPPALPPHQVLRQNKAFTLYKIK